ncbi:hypothetical protein A4H97_09330 [Niastella yeongjuensis]|uniref:Uncharacterized protein n=1 Tax=Niastella yeongjuensis TaxID=354355 RepID=A0A1V9EET4_9BACT|nr:hypothetical protein [Niastella yeongjuensis]OQP44561.1 hypothetical protein A4H97_09330 [Niastella yeongjuensis]SEO83394.1 hypothetical protein SAMN05660816_03680 [Niastella yeongjuensis]
MKKMIAVFVLACAFNAASAKIMPGIRVAAKTNAFVQPFSAAYALDTPFLWFTDPDYTNPTGTYCDVFYEINRLSAMFSGFAFSHLPYGNLIEFEYGIGIPWLYQNIYSDLPRF